MPKVTPKTAPKQTAKNATKATSTSKVDEAAKAKADRAKLVESLSADLATTFVELKETDDKRNNLFFGICDEVKAVVTANELTKEDARQLIKLAMAEAYGVEVDEINQDGNSTLYGNLSKILVLVFPVDKAAEKALAKVRAKGVTVANALLVARGKMSSAPTSTGKGGDTTKKGANAAKNGKDVIDDTEVLGNEFSAIIARAVKGKMDLDVVEEAFATSLADYRDSDGEDESED